MADPFDPKVRFAQVVVEPFADPNLWNTCVEPWYEHSVRGYSVLAQAEARWPGADNGLTFSAQGLVAHFQTPDGTVGLHGYLQAKVMNSDLVPIYVQIQKTNAGLVSLQAKAVNVELVFEGSSLAGSVTAYTGLPMSEISGWDTIDGHLCYVNVWLPGFTEREIASGG